MNNFLKIPLETIVTENSALNSILDMEKDCRCYSKVCNSELKIDPLVVAAAPIFSLAAKLKTTKEPQFDKSTLFANLSCEIKAFMSKAIESKCRSHVVMMASYALCSLLDETILYTSWGQAFNWQQENLLWFFHKQNYGGEHFFILLDRAYQDQALYIDLLELFYLCLSMGFMGKYRGQSDGANALNKINLLLYSCILKRYGNLEKSLYVSDETPVADVLPIKRQKNKWLVFVFVSLCSLVLSAGLVSFYNVIANKVVSN